VSGQLCTHLYCFPPLFAIASIDDKRGTDTITFAPRTTANKPAPALRTDKAPSAVLVIGIYSPLSAFFINSLF